MIVHEKHTVPEDISKIRLIDYIVKTFAGIPSKTGMKKAIKRGEVLIDGKEAKQSQWIKPGQLIEWIEKPTKQPKIFERKLTVIFEDEFLAVIDKPAGVSVSGNKYDTIVNALPYNLTATTDADALKTPYPVHRLDYPTSGLLIVAKTKTASINLGHQFEKRTIKKKYCAIVAGVIAESGRIETPLEGQEAITDFSLIKSVPSLKVSSLSLIHLSPFTGRTHQLRKHMALNKTPIVGDSKYTEGVPLLKGKGLFLCAIQISFFHPITKETMEFAIEAPPKFSSILKREELRWKKYRE